MAEVKAQFPIGKTQWAKWCPEQKIAFNETRAAGVPFADAVKYVNELELVEVNIAPQPEPKKKHGFLGTLEETLDGLKKVESAVETVAEVAVNATPVVAVAKTVIKAAKKKGK